MSSIIVLDSSDEEGGGVKKKPRAKNNQKQQQAKAEQQQMARVNPVKVPNSTMSVNKTQAPPHPNDNFKIQLPSKRPTQQTLGDLVLPEKRVRRVKPMTVVSSNDEEWIKRQNMVPPQWNGGDRQKEITPTAISKNVNNPLKTTPQTRVAPQIPTSIQTTVVSNSNANRNVQNNANGNNMIQIHQVRNPANFVRTQWNGTNTKPSSPTVVNKNIAATFKEQFKSLPTLPVINKNITATAKDPNIPTSLSSSPVFNKNSVTIRRIVVNDDRQKPVPLAQSITNKMQTVNQNSPTIKRVQPTPANSIDPLSITMPPSMNLNNSSIKITQISPTSPSVMPVNQSLASLKKNPQSVNELPKGYQHLPTLKRNDSNSNAKQVQQQQDPIAIVSTSPPMLYSSPATIRKVLNVEIPPKPSAASTIPVISKVFGSGVSGKFMSEKQPLKHLGTSVITKTQTKPLEQKMSPTVVHKPPPVGNQTPPVVNQTFPAVHQSPPVVHQSPPVHQPPPVVHQPPPVLHQPPQAIHQPPPAVLNRPSGLIVTPITCTIANTTSNSFSYSTPLNTMPTVSHRSSSKQTKASLKRSKALQAAQEQALASMYNMYPPGNFMPHPHMMYNIDPSGRAFINPAYIPNRPMRPMDGLGYPALTSPPFNANYPSFSGGSITPMMGSALGASPTYNSGRSSKSPVTSTITRPSSTTKSPANFMGMSVDVDQPLPPMSPPVYNMNLHPPFNGDPFGFIRNPHNIPSPSFSPVRTTRSPSSAALKTLHKNSTEISQTPAMSPAFPRDLDSFVKNSFNYPQTANYNKFTTNTTTSFSNGPMISANSSPKVYNPHFSPTPVELFKTSPVNPLASPTRSTISDGSVTEVFNNSNSKDKPSTVGKRRKKDSQEPVADDVENSKNIDEMDENKMVTEKQKEGDGGEEEEGDEGEEGEAEEEEEEEEEEEVEPVIPEYENLIKICKEADPSDDMNRLIDTKLYRYYYSVHPDFVKSRGFNRAVAEATENIKKNPDLVYYYLKPVVEELKARKQGKPVAMKKDDTSSAGEAGNDDKEDKVRCRQIKRLNKALYILTRKIHQLENDEVDLEDENSTYLIVERFKKRACEIYDKICDLTGECKNALRQVKKPISFKETEYPKFNKVVETYVNKTKEFPDFMDVLRMLEFCNERYSFGLVKEEMTSIAQGSFIKIGKLLQSRRKVDLYETVSHFTADAGDPAENDPILLAKLAENKKKQTSIGSVIDKYAREQVRRKADLTSDATSLSANSEISDLEEESCDEEQSETKDDSDTDDNESKGKAEGKESKEKAKNNHKDNDEEKDKCENEDTDNDKDNDKDEDENKSKDNDTNEEKMEEESENPPQAIINGTKSPPPNISDPPAEAPSPNLSLPSTSAAFRTSPPHAFESPEASPRPRSLSPILPSCSSDSLKILSVTTLNKAPPAPSSPKKIKDIIGMMDEIVISDEDL